PTESNVSSSLLDNQQATPTNSPTKSAGIRKVYSTADRNEQRERERMRSLARAEARKSREGRRGPAAGEGQGVKREFSYSRAGAIESANAESAITRGHRAPRSELSAVTESTERTERTERTGRSERRRRSRSRASGMPGGYA